MRALALLLFLSGLAPAADLPSGSIATVEALKGLAEKKMPGAIAWDRLFKGERLPEGAAVRTQSGATVDLKTDRGHKLHLKSDSTIELTALQTGRTEARLEAGSVVSTVKHLKLEEKFNILTPTAVCAVRGTQFETRAGAGNTWVAVFKGVVGVSAAGSGNEIALHPGQMTTVHNGLIELPHAIPRESRSATENNLSRAARHEVGLDMTRNQVIAAAAEERRLAEYQEGKTLVDVQGKRVRIEEYVVRPQPNQFKLVALNERGQSQLDYFFYQATVNKDLPTDLSVAIKQLGGKIGNAAPDYYVTSQEIGQSNTQDSLHDTSTGGHLVKVTFDGSGNYVLTDPSDPSNTRTIPIAQANGTNTYSVYNPINDSYSTVDAATLASATRFGIYLPENDTYKDLAQGDTLWKTRFNTYEHDLNGVQKQLFTKDPALTNVLATDLDSNKTYAGGSVTPVVVADPNRIDATVSNYYGDGTFESYRTVIIDDFGNVAPRDAFAAVSTGSAYRNELLRWNYEQQVSATEFQGRKLDLVVEPRIFIESGLIQ